MIKPYSPCRYDHDKCYIHGLGHSVFDLRCVGGMFQGLSLESRKQLTERIALLYLQETGRESARPEHCGKPMAKYFPVVEGGEAWACFNCGYAYSDAPNLDMSIFEASGDIADLPPGLSFFRSGDGQYVVGDMTPKENEPDDD